MNAQEILNSLKADLKFYKKYIKEVADEIIRSGYSKYPVFIAHQFEVNIGEVILNRDDFGKTWTINATILEDLVEEGVVLPEKEEYFKSVYKDPEKNMCIFLISEKGGNFVFLPYSSL
ncbi:MAG TPA: hypothetical protein P5050_05770 [Bacteroidia bacterium]|nr:hypothetical protein [Sphingobacteriales bacterium]HPD65127.1 hypothetical protein [Bacteroidia bacterium]HRS58712.1 hypothetical protein [Bacteroidia bacterium]HRU68365.1 hypothetical protein [Bacteroidia bacterium]